MNYTYAAIRQIKPGRYGAQVRTTHGDVLAECRHAHKSRSVALACAEKIEKGL